MKKLRDIVEVVRSPERAVKLADYIFNRNPKRTTYGTHATEFDPGHEGHNLIPLSNYAMNDKYKGENYKEKFVNVNHKDYPGSNVEYNIPIHKIYTCQNSVLPSIVKKKILRQDDVPTLIHHVKTDTYHVLDGNHRINAEKLKGTKHISAKIIKDYEERF